MSDKKPTFFVREATGLVKTASPFDVLFLTLSAAGPIVFFLLGPLTLPSTYEGVGVLPIMVLVLLIIIPFGYNTVSLASTMPRTGGDYVFGSRIIHPSWGLMVGILQLTSMIMGSATIAIAAWQTYFGTAITIPFPGLASSVSTLFFTPTNIFLINVATIVCMYGLAMVSTRLYFNFLKVIMAYGFLMIFVFLGYLLFTPLSTIMSNFNAQAITSIPYQSIIANATAAGWSPNVTATITTTAGALIFVLLFLAAPISTFFSGEMKNAGRSMWIGMFGGSMVAWTVSAIGTLAVIGVFGYDFMSAYGYEAFVNPATVSSGTFSLTTLILAVVGNPAVASLIAIGLGVATLGFLAAGILPASRIIFSWSFDRVIPDRFASVSERTHTPIIALATIVILASALAYVFGFFSSFIGPWIAFSIIVVLAFLPNGITSMVLPFRKNIYQLAPSFVQKKVAGIPLIFITGLLHTLAFGTVLALVFINPSFAGTSNGVIGAGAITFILLLIVLAIIAYPIARAIRAGQGIRLDEVYREIPPE